MPSDAAKTSTQPPEVDIRPRSWRTRRNTGNRKIPPTMKDFGRTTSRDFVTGIVGLAKPMAPTINIKIHMAAPVLGDDLYIGYLDLAESGGRSALPTIGRARPGPSPWWVHGRTADGFMGVSESYSETPRRIRQKHIRHKGKWVLTCSEMIGKGDRKLLHPPQGRDPKNVEKPPGLGSPALMLAR